MKKGKNGKKGKKGGKGGGKKGKKPAPRADQKPGFVLPEAEKGLCAPGYGWMVTKLWADAYWKKHSSYPLWSKLLERTCSDTGTR
jgi:hypothetical protein